MQNSNQDNALELSNRSLPFLLERINQFIIKKDYKQAKIEVAELQIKVNSLNELLRDC
jgi:hypothetical protein